MSYPIRRRLITHPGHRLQQQRHLKRFLLVRRGRTIVVAPRRKETPAFVYPTLP